jgi:hypothetical protein
MAGEVASPEIASPQPASPAVVVSSTDSLYRGINPEFYHEGQLTSGVFFLKKKHTLQQGPSVGIVRLIPLENFKSLIGSGWGVGELSASVPLGLNLTVQPLPDARWGDYAGAHAVMTDYQKMTDKGRTDVARALKNALQQKILVKPTG